MDFLKGVATPSGQAQPSVTVPTTPTIGTVTVSGGHLSIPISVASTHPDGIAGYRIYIGTSSGAETFLANASVWPYVTSVQPAGTYYIKVKGFTPFGVDSAYSNEATATVSGGLAPDTHAPAAPSAPTNESGGGTTLESVASVTPTADDSSHSGTEVVSGSSYVAWYDDGVTSAAKNSLIPSIGTNAVVQIGASVSGAGADDGATLTSCLATSGDPHYGASDAGVTFSRAPVTGKITMVAKVTAATAGSYWDKPFILEVRSSDQADAAYFNALLFSPSGASTVISEWRTSQGAQASQSSSSGYTLPVMLKVEYDPDTGMAKSSWSQNVSSPSYITLKELYIPAIGKQYYAGKAAAGTVSSTSASYASFSRTSDSVVRYSFTGSQQAGATTTRIISAKVVDSAGNMSPASATTSWIYDASSTGGGGGGGVTGPGTSHAYPRRGYQAQGFTQVPNDPAARAQIAKANLVVLGGNAHVFYPCADAQFGAATRAQIYKDLKDRSAVLGTDIKIVQYTNFNEYPLTGLSYQGVGWMNAVTSANWSLYHSGTSGGVAIGAWGMPLINFTHYAPKYSGLYPYQFAAKQCLDFFINGNDGSPNASANASTDIDYFHLDNWFWYSRNGDGMPQDWRRDGSGYVEGDEFRQGESDFFTYGRTLDSTRGWGGNGGPPMNDSVNSSYMVNMADYSYMEWTLGGTTSIRSREDVVGTLGWLAEYHWQATVANVDETRPICVGCWALNSTGNVYYLNDRPFQGFRYFLALVSMGPGYMTDGMDETGTWVGEGRDFDEWVRGADGVRNWLGQPLEGFQLTPRIAGSVLYRDFQYGRVYLNCRDQNPVTIDLTGFQRLTAGTLGNPDINNGAIGGTYSIPSGDGLFVKRL